MGEGSWVGLDVHARSTVAGVLDGVSGELRTLRVPVASSAAVAWLQTLPAPVRVAYEAGPTGYLLARACAEAGIECVVAASSKIPRGSGELVKTDRRDAERLARLLRVGELVAVRVPSVDEEAARDLVRSREDARGDLMRARHRLSKLLLRHGRVYDRAAWTQAHERWLDQQRFQSRPLTLAFEEAYATVAQAKARRDALDQAIVELAAEPRFRDIVGRLACLRGVSTLTALSLTVELGDWQRFRPGALGPFLGLTPREHSSGSHRRQGAITKTGNSHARWLLIEAAWHQRRPPRPSAPLERRRAGQPAAVRRQADHSARRLHHRWRHLEQHWQTTHDHRRRRRTRTRRPLLDARDHELTTTTTAAPARRAQRRTTRRATREERTGSHQATPGLRQRHRSPIAHTVMRPRPANIRRDTHVDNSRRAPPAENTPVKGNSRCP
jgi:transposase